MKILLVEDDRNIGKLITAVLEKWRQETVLVRDTTEAWKVLTDGKVDLLITDWMLENTSGTDLVKKVREEREFDETPILMISGKAQKPAIIEAIETGIDGYLTKPFTPSQLRDKLKAVLNKNKKSAKEQVEKIFYDHYAFDKRAESPFVLFGEPVNTAAELGRPDRQGTARYLTQAIRAIGRINAENSELNLGYRIEPSTQDLIKYIKQRVTRDRIKLVLVSTDCSGNSILLTRLIKLNYRERMGSALVCDHPELIPLNHRAGLEKLEIDLFERKELGVDMVRQLIDQYAIQNIESAEDPLKPDEIRQHIMDDLEAMSTLPVLPQVYQHIISLSNDPDSDIKEWARAIKVDPMSCAAVLRHVRSPAYGFKGDIQDVERAVVLMGKNTVKDLVASEAVKRAFNSVQDSGFSLENYWLHNVAVGFVAYLLSFPLEERQWTHLQRKAFDSFQFDDDQVARLRKIDFPRCLKLDYSTSDPFIGGMMHDIGKAAMVQSYPGLYSLLIDELEESDWSIPMSAAETQVAGGLTHPVVGEILSEKWELGQALGDVVRNHHQTDINDTFTFLIGVADIIGQVLYPFPQEANYPLAEALKKRSLERVEQFLPLDFFDQPLLSAEDLAELAAIISRLLQCRK